MTENNVANDTSYNTLQILLSTRLSTM